MPLFKKKEAYQNQDTDTNTSVKLVKNNAFINHTVLYKTKSLNATSYEYNTLQEAYEYFNNKLFGGKLPNVLITMQHNKKSRGYYRHESFEHRTDDSTLISEIALNPDLFTGRTDKDILSTLVHEQAHLWQFAYGEPSRKGYHNREWGDKMKEIGLYPSNTGLPNGKETGQQMTHYIIREGNFDKTCDALLAMGFKLNWQSQAKPSKEPKKQTRTKYCCPQCELSVWAKPDINLICEDCSDIEEQLIVKLEAKE